MTYSIRLLALTGLLLAVLGGCTRHYYGVPEDDWHRMSWQERNEIILLYQERRLHEERRRAAEAEIHAEEMAAMRHRYPKQIYLHLSGGVFIYHGKRYSYRAHDFKLQQGQVRKIVLVSMHDDKPHHVKLWVRYHEGKVMLGDGKRYLRSFDYRDSWSEGEHYPGVKMRGALELDQAELYIGAKPRKPKPDRANGNGSRGDAGHSSSRGGSATGVEGNHQRRDGDEQQGRGDLPGRGDIVREQPGKDASRVRVAPSEKAQEGQARKEQARKEQAREEQAGEEQARKEQARKERVTRKEQARQERAARKEQARKERAEKRKASGEENGEEPKDGEPPAESAEDGGDDKAKGRDKD